MEERNGEGREGWVVLTVFQWAVKEVDLCIEGCPATPHPPHSAPPTSSPFCPPNSFPVPLPPRSSTHPCPVPLRLSLPLLSPPHSSHHPALPFLPLPQSPPLVTLRSTPPHPPLRSRSPVPPSFPLPGTSSLEKVDYSYLAGLSGVDVGGGDLRVSRPYSVVGRRVLNNLFLWPTLDLPITSHPPPPPPLTSRNVRLPSACVSLFINFLDGLNTFTPFSIFEIETERSLPSQL